MTYFEEKVVKEEAIVRYVEEGFDRSVRAFAEDYILTPCTIDEIPEKFERLLLEYEALKDLRSDLERAKEYLERDREREAEAHGS